MIRKQLTALGLAAGLAAGGGVGFALAGSTGIAGAQTDTATSTPASSSNGSNSSSTTTAARPDPSTRFAEVLTPLVDDGTLTQAQADKVIEALVAAGPPDGGGRGGPGGRHGGPGLEVAATALGMTNDELRTEISAGSSIADVAATKGVDVNTVIAAIVAEHREHLAEEVASGKLTQEQADERAADDTDRVTAMVNGELPEGGPGGPGAKAPADGSSSDTTTTTAG